MVRDRGEAGQKLAGKVRALAARDPVVLALSRGGVPVGTEIARAIKAPLDLVIVGKVGAPGNAELAVAAIVDGNPPDVVLNREIVEAYDLDDVTLGTLADRERPELDRRRRVYRAGRPPLPIAGRTAILVDDGVATGTTMKVAIRALKRRSPREIVIALPVAPPQTVAELGRGVDRIVCLSEPSRFHALGYHYREFPQLTDEEVVETLRQQEPHNKVALQSG